MPQTIGGIVCQELVESFQESFDIQQGPTAVKGYLCNWADRFTVAKGLLGLSTTVSIGGLINLQTPAQYPELNTMYAASVSIHGVGPPTQGAIQQQYTNAKVMVNYRCLPWSFAGISGNDFNNQIDPGHPYIFAEQNMSFSQEFITVPGQKVYYKTTSRELQEPWGFRSPLVNFTISIKYLPYMPAGAVIAALAAPISSTTYLGVSAGNLLFNGVETHQVRMSDGSLTQSADYSFSYRPIAPWDYVYNPGINGWDQVVDSMSNPIAKRSDLSTIIPSYYGF